MTYLLDTNVCIRFLNGRSTGVLNQLEKRQPSDIVICSIVKSELIYGSYSSQNPTHSYEVQRRFWAPYRSLPFDDAAAAVAGLIRSQLAHSETPIGPYDVQIAAIALVHECTLVTHNIREFSRISELMLEDWESTGLNP
jgi:tRNA(fMet)-specific endonuclease VapC